MRASAVEPHVFATPKFLGILVRFPCMFWLAIFSRRNFSLLGMKMRLSISRYTFALAIFFQNPFAHFVDGAAISSPASFSLLSNHSNPLLKNSSFVSDIGSTPYHCTESPIWSSASWNPADCAVALLRLALTEADRYGDQDFEFLGPWARPEHAMPPMYTPRRYTSGKHEPIVGRVQPDTVREQYLRSEQVHVQLQSRC